LIEMSQAKNALWGETIVEDRLNIIHAEGVRGVQGGSGLT
jgi:hypothetical protein